MSVPEVIAGSEVNITCNSGYSLDGQRTTFEIYCKWDGTFSLQKNGPSATERFCKTRNETSSKLSIIAAAWLDLQDQ